MKILAVHLLRVGDLLMAAPILQALKRKYPNARLDVLANAQCVGVAELMAYVDGFISFPRLELQTGLGEADVPFFQSYEKLSSIVDELNQEKYDLVVNFTQNRLSGWLMSLIDSQNKLGLCFDHKGSVHFGSPWFQYLNEQNDFGEGTQFHLNDIFAGALELEANSINALCETARGMAEVQAFTDRNLGRNIICVQPLTSDAKKNWGLARFQEAILGLSARNPALKFIILCAPDEKNLLLSWVENLQQLKIDVDLACVSFAGALTLLKASRLLITGDTSIKHLAASAGVQILEISIGSANPSMTGTYRDGSIFLQSRELCYPCPHSQACHRENHSCATGVPSELVAAVASELLAKNELQLYTLAREYRLDVIISKVRLKDLGAWSAVAIDQEINEHFVAAQIHRLAQKTWLDRRRGEMDLGFKTQDLFAMLKQVDDRTRHPFTASDWRHIFGNFEAHGRIVDARINSLQIGIKHYQGAFEDRTKMRELLRMLLSFRERIKQQAFSAPIVDSLAPIIEDDLSAAFVRLRRIKDFVLQIEYKNRIALKILRSLEGEMDRSQGVELS